MTCIGMEYFCFKGDGLWSSSDSDLAKLAASELVGLGLANQEDVVDARVVRVPKAYPIYDSAYTGHLEKIREAIDPISNLHTVGRNGMHKYNNQDHSMLTAMMTVDNMLGASTTSGPSTPTSIITKSSRPNVPKGATAAVG